MHFIKFAATAFVALAPFVAAQTPTANGFTSFQANTALQAGSQITMKWNPTTPGTVSLVLRYGNPGDLTTVNTIVSGYSNSGSYTWTVPTNIPSGNYYTVEIIDDSDPSVTNYSHIFQVTGGTTGPISSVVSTTMSSSSSSSSSSASSSSSSSASSSSSSSSSASSMTPSGSMTTTPSMPSTASGAPVTASNTHNAALARQTGAAMAALFGAGFGVIALI